MKLKIVKNKISHPEKLKTQGTGVIKKKIILIFVIIGAILGSVVPFIHIIYPKTAPEVIELNNSYDQGEIDLKAYTEKSDKLYEKYQYFGFSNIRRFLFAIGTPIALLCISLFMIFIARYISDKYAILATLLTGSSFMFTAVYFIIWTLWAYTYEEKDFPILAYYACIVISSLMVSLTIFFYSISNSNYDLKIKELVHLVVNARKGWFNTLEKHESYDIAKEEKDKFDDKMYETFERVGD